MKCFFENSIKKSFLILIKNLINIDEYCPKALNKGVKNAIISYQYVRTMRHCERSEAI